MPARGPFSRWIFEAFDVPERSLAISRILFCVSLLAFWFDPNNPRYLWTRNFPASFYAPPPGLGMFFSHQPAGWIMWLLFASVMTLTLAVLVGWNTRGCGLLLSAVLLVGNSFEYSFGKINHDILMILVVGTMSFSGWDRALSIDARRRTFQTPAARWPLSLLALLVGLAMFTAGWPKAASGWLDPALLCAKGQLVSNYYAAERPTVVGHFMLTHGSAWFWKMMDWSTVAIELSFLPSAFSLRAFRTVATLAVFFHAGIHFSMDIFFYQNLLAYAMFVDWERQVDSGWLKQGQAAFDRLLQRVRPWMLPVGGLLVAVVFSTFGNPVVRLLDLFGDGRWLRDSIAAILVVLFALKCIVGFAGTRWRSLRRSSAPSRAGETAPEPPLVLFDGVCGLCNGFVDFVLKRDRHAVFRFAPLQSESGRSALGKDTGRAEEPESIVLIADGQRFRHSAAALRILGRLGLPWSLAYGLLLAPPPVRDFVYEVVARHRYRWFGRKSVCRVPTVAERTRFLA